MFRVFGLGISGLGFSVSGLSGWRVSPVWGFRGSWLPVMVLYKGLGVWRVSGFGNSGVRGMWGV